MATFPLDALPFITLLNLVLEQVEITAAAARDMCFEKRSFNELSEYLACIHEFLTGLSHRKLDDVSAVSNALLKLHEDVKKGDDLITKVKNYSPLRNLLCCRSMMREFQKVVKDIGYALEALKLASSEITVDFRERIDRVKEQMQLAEYIASEENLEIVDEIDRGLSERRQDREFANEILTSIARNLGLSQEPSNISRELANLHRDKELAAANKELLEGHYLEQVIALLSRADAAYSWQASQSKYEKIKTNCNNGLAPYSSFRCPLTGNVMTDPVIAADGKTYERKAIEEWFTNPDTRLHLPDTNLRPNRTLLDSINEWKEQNYVARILNAKSQLQSGMEVQQTEAFVDVTRLCKESLENKDWIAFEGLIPLIVKILQSCSPRLHKLKESGLSALYTLVQNNERNQLQVVNAKGVEFAMNCLGRKNVAKEALMFLAEMLTNEMARRAMELEKSFFVWVGTYRLGDDAEIREVADILLTRLSDKDENIVKMAEVHWYDPLVKRLCGETGDARLKMAFALSELELSDKNIELLAEKVVPVYVDMLGLGNLDAQLASLTALQKLSSNNLVRRCIAEAGAVRMLLTLISDSRALADKRELASAIFENLVCKCGTLYLVDTNGMQLEEEEVVTLLVRTFSSMSTLKIRLHVLKSLLELARTSTATNMRSLIRRKCYMPLQNLFLQNPVPQVREPIVRLLFYLCEEEGVNQIASFFSANETLKSLVQMAKTPVSTNIQEAAAGLIAKVAHHDRAMKAFFVTVHTLEALVDMLKSNEIGSVESALDALLIFTDPSDAGIQLQLASLDIFAYLKELLKSRSCVTKVRAASVLRNLSMSSAYLSANSPVKGLWRVLSPCKVHLGKCEAKTTLCILKANAVPQLVVLLSDQEVEVAEAGLDALLTLFGNNCRCENAVEVLHAAGVMEPLSHLLTSSRLAWKLLDKILEVPRMRNLYCYLSRAK